MYKFKSISAKSNKIVCVIDHRISVWLSLLSRCILIKVLLLLPDLLLKYFIFIEYAITYRYIATLKRFKNFRKKWWIDWIAKKLS